MRPYTELYRRWISAPNLHAADIAVLSALYAHADDSGVCRRTQGELAEELGQSRAWIHAVLKRLQDPSVALVATKAHRGFRGFLYALTDAEGAVFGVTASDRDRQPADTRRQAAGFSFESWNPESSSFSAAEEKTAGERATELFDWSPTTDDLAWALAERPDVDAERVTRKFVSWCRKAQARNGYRPDDPTALWRRWILRELVTPTDPPPSAPDSSTAAFRPASVPSSARHDRNRPSAHRPAAPDANPGGQPCPWGSAQLAARNHDTLAALRARLSGTA